MIRLKQVELNALDESETNTEGIRAGMAMGIRAGTVMGIRCTLNVHRSHSYSNCIRQKPIPKWFDQYT